MGEPDKQDITTTEVQQETPETVTPPEIDGGEDTGAIQLTSAQLAQRLERAQQTALNKLFETLGVDNADEIKQVLEAEKQRQEAEMSALEKVQAELEKERQRAADAQAQLEKAEQQRKEDNRNAEIMAALKEAEKPRSVLNLLLAEHADKVSAVVADDGTLDSKAIAALVETARAEYEGMFKPSTPGSPSHAGGKTPSPDRKKVLEDISKRFRY